MASSLLFKNARLTDDASKHTYNVLLQEGRVASITKSSEDPDAPAAKRVIDLNGAYIAPSMIDSHVHFSVWAKSRKHINVGSAKNLSELLNILKEALETHNPNNFAMLGQKLMVGAWPSEDIVKLQRETLDNEISSDIPIFIYFSDLHSALANTAALKLLEFENNPTGLLLEKDCFASMVKLNKLDEEHIHDDLMAACQDAAQKGVTEMVDLDIDYNIKNWTKRVKAGMNYLRVECGLWRPHLEEAIEAGYKSGDIVPDTEGLVTVGPHKIVTDGSLGTRTACCHDAYPSPPAPPNDFGYLAYPASELKSMFEFAIEHKYRLAVHAIGDKAHTVVLETMLSLDNLPLPGSTIEHAQQLKWEDLPKFKQLGLIASIQPMHQIDDIELADRFWPGRTDRAFPYKAIVDEGIAITMGSDAPVAVLDPWLAIAAAISRSRPGEEAKPWHPEQKISLRQAYEASTSGRRLRVKEGDVADICILELDPLEASVEQLRSMHVKATLLAGRFTWNALDQR